MIIIRRLGLFIIAVFLLIITQAMPLKAEHFFLRNGEIIESEITNQNDFSFTLKLPGKNGTKIITRKDVLRILYSSDYKNPVYIYRPDGSVTMGFIIEENPESYIIRKNLTSPEEIQFQKKEINFVARRQIRLKGSTVKSRLRVGVVEIDGAPIADIKSTNTGSVTAQFITNLILIDRYAVRVEPIPINFIRKNNLELDGIHDSEDTGRICAAFGLDAVIFVKIFRRGKHFAFSGENLSGENGSVLASEYIKFSKESEIPAKLERLAYALSGYSEFGQQAVWAERDVKNHRFGFKFSLMGNIPHPNLDDNSPDKAFGFSLSAFYSWRYFDAELNYTGRYFNGANDTGVMVLTAAYPHPLIGIIFGYYFINTYQIDYHFTKYGTPVLYQTWNWHSLLFGLNFRFGNTLKLGVGIGLPMYLSAAGTFLRHLSAVVYQGSYKTGLCTFDEKTITDKKGLYPSGPYIVSLDWMIVKNHGIGFRLVLGAGAGMTQHDDINQLTSLYLGYTQIHLSYIFMF